MTDDDHAGRDGQLLEAIATWLDAVRSVLKADVKVLTVERSDAPASLTVKVRPDQDGIAAFVALVRWADPELVLLEPPEAQRPDNRRRTPRRPRRSDPA